MIAPRLSRGLCLLVGLGLLAGACSPKRAATTAPTSSPSIQAVSPTVTAPAAAASSPPASPATTRTSLAVASYDSSYVPPPEILPIPLQAVTLPTQSWYGAQCSGTLQLTVQGPETATAAGQPWSVWRIHSVVHYVAQSSVDVTL